MTKKRMRPKTRAETEADVHRRARARVAAMTAAQARQTFVDSGIVHPDGTLTKQYSGMAAFDLYIELRQQAMRLDDSGEEDLADKLRDTLDVIWYTKLTPSQRTRLNKR
jgi:hypothetical protein